MSREKTGRNLPCNECGDEIYVPKWKLEDNDNYFCSKKCHDSFQTNKIEKPCEYCGNTMKRIPSEMRTFCSTECYGKDKESKITVDCYRCSTKISHSKSRVENQDKFYCSKKCRSEKLSEEWLGENNPNYTDGRYKQFGDNWIKFRDKIRERAPGYCEGCGKSRKLNGRKLDIHHIIPRSYFIDSDEHTVEDSNRVDNLVALCQTCHSKEEKVCKKVLNNIIL